MKSKLILLVDDDRNLVATTKRVLQSSGYKVIIAYNSEQCYGQLKKKKPNLIILDIMMEKTGSGFDVCRKLKHNKKTKDIPVVIMSAIDKVHPFKFATATGDETWLPADGFLNKPVQADALIKEIKRLIK